MVLLILGLALPCRALSIRDWKRGWRLGGIVAALLVAAAAVDFRMVLSGARVTTLVILAFAMAATMGVGLVLERRSSAPRRSWNAVGMVLSCAYCGMIIVGACGVTFLYGINGLPPSTPPVSEILPLPKGLAITENVDEQCGDGSTSICTRRIHVASNDEQSEATMVHELDARLVASGWEGGYSCRARGVLLDRNLECVTVAIVHGQVTVELDDSSGW